MFGLKIKPGKMKKNRSGKQRGASRKVRKEPFRLDINMRPILVCFAVSLFLLGSYQGVALLREKVDLPVKSVAIYGGFQYVSKQEIAKQIEPYTHDSYLTTDLEAIKKELEAQPWISQAGVKRQWPDQLAVWVIEEQPIARWGKTGFINLDGKLFKPQKMIEISGLPYLQGPDENIEEVLQDFRNYAALLKPLGLSVESLVMDRKGAKTLLLADGMELVLGVGDSDEKFSRFLAVYQSQLASRVDEISRVDMRYTNGLAVRWRPAVMDIAQH